jgi:hypothetical protein
MPQYLKQHGERLVELGYRVVPIPLGGKGPKRKGWPQFRADAAQVRQWYTNGSADDGVGIIAATTPAVDVDILDPEVAGQMADAIDDIFEGHSLLIRTGRAPKFLIPFRSETPFRKMSSATYTDGTHEHKVEILGDGQQWVAYHTHPDTNSPYQWFDGLSDAGINDVAQSALPVLTRESAQRVIDAFELLAAGLVASGQWSVKSSTVEKKEAPDEDPFAQHAEPTDLTRSQVEWLVHKCEASDYKRWIDVGMMLHHQYKGEPEGFALWDAWSSNAHNYDAGVMEQHWDSFGIGSAAPQTLRALIKEFGQPSPKQKLPNSGFVPAAQFASSQRVEWHIKHVLPKRGLIVVYGDPGSSKSFFTLDMVAHVARGLMWRGHRVRQANVAYIAAEGVAGFGNRLAAYSKHHAVSLNELPVFVRGGAFDLKEQFLDISEKISEVGNVGVVVIDTLAAVTAGGNENTSEDMGSAIDAAQRIIESTGASVILIHHSNNQGGVRGWSGLRGAVDNQIRIERKDSLRTAHIEKQKEGEDGKAYGYRLQVVHLYDDEDGDPVTSCAIVEDEDVAPNTRGTKKEKKSTGGDFSTSDKYAKARKYLEIIRDAAGLGDANIDETDVITAIQADETVNPLKESDYPRPDNIKRTLLTLGEHGKIKREGRWIRVCE